MTRVVRTSLRGWSMESCWTTDSAFRGEPQPGDLFPGRKRAGDGPRKGLEGADSPHAVNNGKLV